MKNRFSVWAIVLVSVCFIAFRCLYFQNGSRNGYNAATWDAFGYYMYLPSVFIYHDVKELKWVKGIDSTYQVTGGVFYQAIPLESGTYTNKYLLGVSILQMPYFLIGHYLAGLYDEPQDGFSSPYQYALIFGAICWAVIGLVLIRKVLLRFFEDRVVAFTIILTGLCSNLIQYVSVDAVQSHVYIFTLYALVLWFTIRWHETPKYSYAILIGLTCGLAVICRPTELIIIFIPLLWNMHTPEARKAKKKMLAHYRMQVLVCVLAGFIGVLPQLVYWYYTTGRLVFDVGSKWYFLNPWFRVLVGPEKGWFLYTPVAILMVWGFRFMKGYPFRTAVLTFCLLNIWIIISWSDWRYGGSYATRALVQSYPVFALSLACFVQKVLETKRTALLAIVTVLFIALNFYQLQLYNAGNAEGFSPFLRFFHS